MKTGKATGLRSTQHTSESADALQDRIRVRAYQLYEQRGGEDGHDTDNWLQVESEEPLAEVQKAVA